MADGQNIDLVIVGAGAAGPGAARAARDLGLEFVVLEAMPRIGGRAHTVTEPFGVPWDRGCHWLHSANVNPSTPLADAYGFRYRDDDAPWRVRLGDRWGAAAGHAGTDVPVSDVVERDATGPDQPESVFATDRSAAWLAQLRAIFAAERGVAMEEVSTRDYAGYRDTDRNWPVEDGYGALVARHAAGPPVTLSTPVVRIAWDGPGVRVTTSRGVVAARAAIVTVSAGVLAAEPIRFDPPLPDWKREAIATVPLGCANKVALRIDGRRLGVAEHTHAAIPFGDGPVASAELRPFGRDLASLYLAGPRCAELERAGDAAMVEAAVGALRDVLGGDAVRESGATACTAWGREPTVRGAYGAARPGQAHRRADLALPLADRRFFAHLSGVAAVAAAAAALVRG